MNKLTVTNIHDYLKNQGVGFLTSESCGIGLRGLFDLTERGQRLVEQFFCTNVELAPWNSHVGVYKAVASIMLPHVAKRPLAIFTLLMNGAEVVFDVSEGGTMIYFADHLTAVWNPGKEPVHKTKEYLEMLELYRKIYKGEFRIWIDSATSSFGRNTHEFSGRTA